MKYRYTYLILLLFMASVGACAKPQYVFQSENPIANFAWDENDTTRYEGHFRYEQAYKMIEDMLSDKRPLNFAEAVFAVENCMYDGELNHSAYCGVRAYRFRCPAYGALSGCFRSYT